MFSSRVFWPTLIILSLLAMLGCGGGSASQTARPAVTDVYAAGYELSDAGAGVLETAKYWKNGEAHVLGNGVNGSFATSIAVSGNDVYVAGLENNGTQDVAKYWKNGVPVELTSGTNRTFANSIFVSGTDVYVAGGEQEAHTTAKYWKNGVPVTLSDLGEGSLANSIFISGQDVYVGGWVAKTAQLDPTHFALNEIASYWKNGVLTQLADQRFTSLANSIFVSHSDIYVAGFACQDNEPNCGVAGYWKNGALVQLANGTAAGANSIFVSGADVYVAGNQNNDFAEAWRNTESVQLTGSTARSAANQVVVSGGDVYIGGAIQNDAGEAVATYWKNGVPVSITDGTHPAAAFALTVVKH
jgi:hypothetical protein